MIRFLASLFGLVPSITVLASDHVPVSSSDVTLVVGDDGLVYSSGDEVDIRGDDRPGTRCHFEPIEGLREIVSVDVCVNGSAAGALDRDGNVWLWGRRWASAIGGEDAASNQAYVPRKIASLGGVRRFSLADSHLIALKDDGTVVTVGADFDANDSGQLGNGSVDVPESEGSGPSVFVVPSINDAIAVEAGGDFNLILRADGTVWGMGNASMLGEATDAVGFLNEDPKRFLVAAPIKGLSNVAAISAGHRFALALDRSGQVWGWGGNHSKQLGTVGSELTTVSPTKIRGFHRVTSIAAGYDFMLATTGAGKVLAMGGNTYGALGDDGEELEGTQRTIAGLSDVKEVFAGHYNGFAKTASNHHRGSQLWGWGANDRTIGGFHATSGPGFVPPTPVDVQLKPAPASATIDGGGVSASIMFDLTSYFFETQTMEISMAGNVIATVELNESKDQELVVAEIPAGRTGYRITGTGTNDEGKVFRIEAEGAFLVSSQTLRDEFDAFVASDGLIEATTRLMSRLDAAVGDRDLPAVDFSHDAPLSDTDLDQIESEFGHALPGSYRQAMKTIGPFRLGAPDDPHPRASLMVPDKRRHVQGYAAKAEKMAAGGNGESEKTDLEPLVDSLFKDVVRQFGYMEDEVNHPAVLGARSDWERIWILGTAGEDLCLATAGAVSSNDRPMSTFLGPFFHQEYDDDGNPQGYFQWAEVAGTNSYEEIEQNLASAVYDAIFAEYSARGVTPLRSTPSNEVVYAILEMTDEEEPDGDQPFHGKLSSDGW